MSALLLRRRVSCPACAGPTAASLSGSPERKACLAAHEWPPAGRPVRLWPSTRDAPYSSPIRSSSRKRPPSLSAARAPGTTSTAVTATSHPSLPEGRPTSNPDRADSGQHVSFRFPGRSSMSAAEPRAQPTQPGGPGMNSGASLPRRDQGPGAFGSTGPARSAAHRQSLRTGAGGENRPDEQPQDHGLAR